MKAERRHELKTNALYAWLNKAAAWSQANRNGLLVGVLVAAALGAVVYLWVRRATTRPHEAWALLAESRTVEQYRQFVAQYGSTRAGVEGRLDLATLLKREGGHDAEARELLQAALDQAGGDEYLGARALLGLAELDEADGRLDDALRKYATLIERYPAPGFAAFAEAQVQLLKSPHRPIPPSAAFAPATRPTTGPATRPISVQIPIPPAED